MYESFKKIDPSFNDVINGKVYKYLVKNKVIGKNDMTITWNTDGIALFTSSKKSTYSILVSINELPYGVRKDNIILCGLWHDSRKPLMKMFLKRFMEELTDLSNHGFECTTFNSNTPVNIKVHTILCSVDTVARPTIQNMKQFNGKHCCPYCLQEGKILEDEGNKRVYCTEQAPDRDYESYMQDIETAISTGKASRGVKGPSVT